MGPKASPSSGNNGAKNFRVPLRTGADRPELFETTDSRLNFRLHDTRATFITIKLTVGRAETWLSERTGHISSDPIHHDDRAVRKVVDLGLGGFAPLDQAISALKGEGGSAGGGAPAPSEAATRAASADIPLASAAPAEAPAPMPTSAP